MVQERGKRCTWNPLDWGQNPTTPSTMLQHSTPGEHPSAYPQKWWYRITSRCYPCPFLSTATSNPALAGTGTILHRRKYETEKYASLSYDNNIIIGKSYVQGWEYFVSVSKLQREPGNYLYAFYDRSIVQTIQRSLFFFGRGTLIYWNKNLTNLCVS